MPENQVLKASHPQMSGGGGTYFFTAGMPSVGSLKGSKKRWCLGGLQISERGVAHGNCGCRHRATTVQAVVVGLVLAEVNRFLGQLKRRPWGCLEAADGVSIPRARWLAWEISRGPAAGKVLSRCGTKRCVRPAHLEVSA